MLIMINNPLFVLLVLNLGACVGNDEHCKFSISSRKRILKSFHNVGIVQFDARTPDNHGSTSRSQALTRQVFQLLDPDGSVQL